MRAGGDWRRRIRRFAQGRVREWSTSAGHWGAYIGATNLVVRSAGWALNRKLPRGGGAVWCVLRRRGHTQDAQSVAAHASKQYTILPLRRRWQQAVTAAYVPCLPDHNYRSYCLQNPESYERAIEAWQAILERMALRHGLSLITTGYVSYGMEQPMMEAARRQQVPFVVIHKESVKTPADTAGWLNIFRQGTLPSAAARILTYNEMEAGCLVEAGVARQEQIHVCGMPRLDALHDRRVARAGTIPPEGVLFLSFGADAGAVARSNTDQSLWSELRQTTHELIVRFAKDNPAVPVTIKGKSAAYDREHLETLLQEIGPKPKNLKVNFSGDGRTLFETVRVVIGFNSTALLEGMASGVPVLIPLWAEAANTKNANNLLLFAHGATQVPDPKSMNDAIKRHIDFPQPVSKRLDLGVEQELSHWVNNPDGRASFRAWQIMQDCLDEYRACGKS